MKVDHAVGIRSDTVYQHGRQDLRWWGIARKRHAHSHGVRHHDAHRFDHRVMALVLCMARGSRGGTFAASAGSGGAVVGGYALEASSTDYNIDTTPIAHWDALDMNGNGDNNSGWTGGSSTVSGTGAWLDRTGVYKFIQSGASNQGTFQSSVINSIPGVEMTAASNTRFYLRNADDDAYETITGDAESWNIYHVAKVTENSNFFGVQGYLYCGFATPPYSGTENFRVDRRITGSTVNKLSITNAYHFTAADAYDKDSWFEVRNYDDGGTAKLGLRWHIDGSVVASASDQSQSHAMKITAFGQSSIFEPGETVCEMIVFNSSLSDSERSTVESYLDDKYAIADS